jgi:hypothetical protein
LMRSSILFNSAMCAGGMIRDIALRWLTHGRRMALRITSTSIRPCCAVLTMRFARSQLFLSDHAKSDRDFPREREAICDTFLHRVRERRLGFEFSFFNGEQRFARYSGRSL